jgi:hypothetical protein
VQAFVPPPSPRVAEQHHQHAPLAGSDSDPFAAFANFVVPTDALMGSTDDGSMGFVPQPKPVSALKKHRTMSALASSADDRASAAASSALQNSGRRDTLESSGKHIKFVDERGTTPSTSAATTTGPRNASSSGSGSVSRPGQPKLPSSTDVTRPPRAGASQMNEQSAAALTGFAPSHQVHERRRGAPPEQRLQEHDPGSSVGLDSDDIIPVLPRHMAAKK